MLVMVVRELRGGGFLSAEHGVYEAYGSIRHCDFTKSRKESANGNES